ncbi:MAG: septal ring lytic transglycosylase RlpA family protein [Dokdonella sp.]
MGEREYAVMTRARAIAVIGMIVTLAACAGGKHKPNVSPLPTAARSSTADDTSLPQSRRYRDRADSAPAVPLDVAKLAEPVPKIEPRARYGNKSPYTVLGHSYEVLLSARGYVERGIASWYGNKFHGYMTSSLETYDMNQFSAAHKTLPLPSYARVTNLDNGKSVIVRINDRGPFHDNRLIDLSYAAAVRIGVWPKGTGLVEVRAIDPDHPDRNLTQRNSTQSDQSGHASEQSVPANMVIQRSVPSGSTEPRAARAVPSPGHAARLFLQIGAYASRAGADRVARAAREAGIDSVRVDTVESGGRLLQRVRIGPLADVAAADALSPRVEQLGFGTPRVAIDD